MTCNILAQMDNLPPDQLREAVAKAYTDCNAREAAGMPSHEAEQRRLLLWQIFQKPPKVILERTVIVCEKCRFASNCVHSMVRHYSELHKINVFCFACNKIVTCNFEREEHFKGHACKDKCVVSLKHMQ